MLNNEESLQRNDTPADETVAQAEVTAQAEVPMPQEDGAAVPEQAAVPVAVATAEETVQATLPEEDNTPAPADEKAERVKAARRTFSNSGLGLGLMAVITFILSNLAVGIVSIVNPGWITGRTWAVYAIQYGAMYLIGFPVFLLLILRLPHIKRKEKEKQKLGVAQFVAAICISFLAVVIGTYVSAFLNSLMANAFGLDITELIQEAMLGMEWYTMVIVMVIIAPLMEEWIFRRLLIDRMRLYGERVAVITSGVMFGLFHGNVAQLVYAVLLGIIFGYIYLRTGKLRYTIALHFIVNGTSVLQNLLLTTLDTDAMQTMLGSELTDMEKIMSIISPAVIGISIIAVLRIVLAIVGIAMLVIYIRKIHFNKAERELPFGKRFSTVWLNPGMLIFMVIMIAQFALNYIMTA